MENKQAKTPKKQSLKRFPVSLCNPSTLAASQWSTKTKSVFYHYKFVFISKVLCKLNHTICIYIYMYIDFLLSFNIINLILFHVMYIDN